MLSEQYETSYLFYVTLSFLCNIICYLISVFAFSLVTLSGATTHFSPLYLLFSIKLFVSEQGVSKYTQPINIIRIYYWEKNPVLIGTAEDSSLRFFATMHVKDQVLGKVFGWTFSDLFQQNLSPHSHCLDILLSTSVRSEIFYVLVEVVYWHSSLKFVYATINLAFFKMTVKV